MAEDQAAKDPKNAAGTLVAPGRGDPAKISGQTTCSFQSKDE